MSNERPGKILGRTNVRPCFRARLMTRQSTPPFQATKQSIAQPERADEGTASPVASDRNGDALKSGPSPSRVRRTERSAAPACSKHLLTDGDVTNGKLRCK